MKITKLTVHSYRGIGTLETTISARGAIVKGKNGAGKTSVLRAIRAALAAQDIAPDAIKQGSDKAEILVDLDDHSVRRVITAKGSTLAVEKAGMKASKPTTYLTELLGGTALDPLDLFLAKPKERKAIVLGALPVTVTREQLAKYAPELPLDFSTDGHALEVIERARKFFYDERTAANKDAADAKRTADRLHEEANVAARAVTPGPIVSAEDAQVAVTAAERNLMALENRRSEAASVAARTAAQHEQIERLRSEAGSLEGLAGSMMNTSELKANVEAAENAVRVLEEQLASSRAALANLRQDLAAAEQANAQQAASVRRAADLRAQAETLATALAAATVAAPADAEVAAAQAEVNAAHGSRGRAALQTAALAAVAAANAAKTTAEVLQAEADELDTTVKRLANDAPTELLAGAKGIPGLSIDGDEVLFEGKRLDVLCGSEQMAVAVEIARRVNAKTRILCVDGLERLDPDQMESFVRMATADDWQLICTRVDRGDVVFEAIEPSDRAEAAE